MGILRPDDHTGDGPAAGGEIDEGLCADSGLVHALLGIDDHEALRGLAPKLERGFHHACDTINPLHRRVVCSGSERFPLAKNVEAVALPDLCEELAST